MHYTSAEALAKLSDTPQNRSIDYRKQAQSLPALVRSQKSQNGEPSKEETIRSLQKDMEYIEKAPPIIFRHSSTERIIADIERPSGRGDSNEPDLERGQDFRPVSAQSEYSVDESAQLKSISLVWTNIDVKVGEESRYSKTRRYFARCCQRKKTPYRELSNEQVRVLKNGKRILHFSEARMPLMIYYFFSQRSGFFWSLIGNYGSQVSKFLPTLLFGANPNEEKF